MRYLGLDLGTKTLGLAISDETGTIANSLTTLRYDNEEDLILELESIINNYKVESLVLGLPKNMNNTIGPRAEATLEFKTKLENLNIPVIMQDERLSTLSAHNYMIEANMSRKKRRTKVDSLAANIILQTYLDRREKNERWKNDF